MLGKRGISLLDKVTKPKSIYEERKENIKAGTIDKPPLRPMTPPKKEVVNKVASATPEPIKNRPMTTPEHKKRPFNLK